MGWELVLIYVGLFVVLLVSIFGGLGLGRIFWWNVKRLKIYQQKINDPALEEAEKMASQVVLSICKPLQSKWILTEKDLSFHHNTRYMVEAVAAAWHPESTFPLSEATLGRLLDAFQELHYRVIRLTRFPGIYKATQFRLRHVVFLSDTWKEKQSLETTFVVRFLRKFRIDFLSRWAYTAFRFFDLSFWFLKMAGYLIYDVWLKTILIHWYLIVGEQADQVYRHRDGKIEADSESILEAMEGLPEPLDFATDSWPKEIKEIVQNSRQRILFNWGSLDWKEIREIYHQLVEQIARHYFPGSNRPMYEATIFSLLASAVRFSDKAASLKSIPLIQKLLGVHLSHLFFLKYVVDLASDIPILDWIKKHDVHKAARYAAILFKTIRRRHPGLLFKELAWVLVSEGLKRWFFLYLHHKMASETQLIFKESKGKASLSESAHQKL